MNDLASPVRRDSSFMEIPLAFLNLINSVAKDFATISAHFPTCMSEKMTGHLRAFASTIEDSSNQRFTPSFLTPKIANS